MPDPKPEPWVLDVRDELKSGGRPMARILDTVKRLAPGQDLLLRATFEPVPLYAVLRLRGFRHASRRMEDGDWEVRFSRGDRGERGRKAAARSQADAPRPAEAGDSPPSVGEAPPESASVPWTRLDNRGLEPPEPMMRTLEALNRLERGDVLEIHNDRRPMFLYPHLTERGYLYQTVDADDGSAYVRIWKPAGANR